MFRFITTVLIFVVTLSSSFALSGLCLVLEMSGSETSGIPSQMSNDDEDCTCRMSSTEHNVTLDVQWVPGLLPVADTMIYTASMKLPATDTTRTQSFDTIAPTPPPKA